MKSFVFGFLILLPVMSFGVDPMAHSPFEQLPIEGQAFCADRVGLHGAFRSHYQDWFQGKGLYDEIVNQVELKIDDHARYICRTGAKELIKKTGKGSLGLVMISELEGVCKRACRANFKLRDTEFEGKCLHACSDASTDQQHYMLGFKDAQEYRLKNQTEEKCQSNSSISNLSRDASKIIDKAPAAKVIDDKSGTIKP